MFKRMFSVLTAILLIPAMMLTTAAAKTSDIAGDADNDGKLTILDATAIQYHIAGLNPLSDSAVQRSMVAGGSKLSILDAAAIQLKLANLIDFLPTEAITEPTEPASPCETQTPAMNAETVSAYEQHAINLINDIRREYGLAELTADPDLCRAARIKAQDMRDQGYFDHISPTYGSPLQMILAFGIRCKAAAENIAEGYKTPQAVVEAWMSASGHRDHILNPEFTRIGVGYIADGSFWTQLFAD